MDPDLNKYDLNHRVTHHPRMSDAEWDEAYRAAWVNYYTPEHMRTILRRAAAHPLGRPKTALTTILWFKLMILYEAVHPLEGGAFRLKFRRDRRHGMQMESRFVFYPRYAAEMVVKAWRYLAVYRRAMRTLRQVLRAPDRWSYTRPRHRAAAGGRTRHAGPLPGDQRRRGGGGACAARRGGARPDAERADHRPSCGGRHPVALHEINRQRHEHGHGAEGEEQEDSCPSARTRPRTPVLPAACPAAQAMVAPAQAARTRSLPQDTRLWMRPSASGPTPGVSAPTAAAESSRRRERRGDERGGDGERLGEQCEAQCEAEADAVAERAGQARAEQGAEANATQQAAPTAMPRPARARRNRPGRSCAARPRRIGGIGNEERAERRRQARRAGGRGRGAGVGPGRPGRGGQRQRRARRARTTSPPAPPAATAARAPEAAMPARRQ